MILANCPTAAGFSVYGGRCLKVTLSLISYATAQEVCRDDGGHLYHYKSLVFDEEPARCCWRAQVNTAAIEGVPLQMQPGGLISVDDCSVCLPTAVDHEKAQL